MIDSMEDGYYKEINALHKQMQDRKTAINDELLKLAQVFRDTEKAYKMTRDGYTEEQWYNSEQGKRSLEDWKNLILSSDGEVAKTFHVRCKM